MREILSVIKEVASELYLTFKKPFLIAGAFFLTFMILTPILIYGYFARDLVSKETIINNNSKGVILYDRNNKPFFNFYEARRKKIVTLSQVPKTLQNAVISVEDKDFYKHAGFSIPAIIRAFYSNISNQEIESGASTITQQLVKNSLLTPKRSYFRKYQEVILAFEIERLYTKEEILEMYLNSVYLGEGAVGVGTGAAAYFSKDIEDLTLAESALLAGILPAPSRYSPISGDVQKALQLQKRVLSKMAEQGFITNTEKEIAENQSINITPTKTNSNITAPHFALLIKDQLLSKYSEQELALSGFKVITTIDLDFQEYAEEIVNQNVKRLAGNLVTNGAAVVMSAKTSEVLALVGSNDWLNGANGKINMAIAPRQPGSSFKPIMYAKAFEDRIITPGTILHDIPTDFGGGYKPKDYDGRYRGNMLPRRALANSINIPAVEIMKKVGVENGVAFANRLGIASLKDPSNYGLSMVLGAAEIPLLEMTNAYAVFANGGTLNSPVTILRIKNKIDEVIYDFTSSSQQVLSSEVAFLISSILSDNLARAEVFGNALTIDRPAAVKTGTTENYRDGLTIGYTPSVVIGVWVGNSDNTPMDQIAGSLGAAPIWRSLMMEFLKDKPIEKFEVPLGLVRGYACGNMRAIATFSATLEYFLPGTQPQGFCDAPITPTPTINSTAEPTKEADKKDKKDKEAIFFLPQFPFGYL